MSQISVSFIIPAFNEELFLPHVLKNIQLYVPRELVYEIIVADNGSDDNTVELATKAGALVIVDECASIGGLRNQAVSQSKGKVLVFLDADILLTEEWQRHFLQVYKSIEADPIQVTGSRCSVPASASWIEIVWFKPLISRPSNYINSGHLVTSRELFNEIGGFDSSLETGEDYAFGMAAKSLNAKIINDPELVVIHKGYPKTVYQFMRREMWHGRGDYDSLKTMLASKVVLVSQFIVLLHVLLAMNFVFVNSGLLTGLLVMLIVLICVTAAVFKHGANTLTSLVLTGSLYYLYFISRALSGISFLSVRAVKRNETE